MDDPAYYRRKLPHWQPRGAEYFVTFTLIRFTSGQPEDFLHAYGQNSAKRHEDSKKETARGNPDWLRRPQIAHIVQESLFYRDGGPYDLYAHCIMPDHVHLVFRLLKKDTDYPVTKILHGLKSYTAREANKILGRKGPFWQRESYDRVIRDDDELDKTINYVINNPVRAGLVDSWEEWDYTYCKFE